MKTLYSLITKNLLAQSLKSGEAKQLRAVETTQKDGMDNPERPTGFSRRFKILLNLFSKINTTTVGL